MKKFVIIISILLLSTASYARTYTVKRVIDGDTLVVIALDGKSEMVQLSGIDSPEIILSKGSDPALMDVTREQAEELQRWKADVVSLSRMGREAAEFVKNLVEGKKVRVEFDVQGRDGYGRLPGYVYIKTCYPDCPITLFGFQYHEGFDGSNYIFLNATIINSGYAVPMAIPSSVKHAELFKKLYEKAREGKRGLWREEATRNKSPFKDFLNTSSSKSEEPKGLLKYIDQNGVKLDTSF